MVSVFASIRDEHIREEPFPHVCSTEALDPDYYRELAANYPDIFHICPDLSAENNMPHALSATRAMNMGILAPVWQEFIAYHHSPAFFHDIVARVGHHMRQAHPDLEERLGKPLEELTVAPRFLSDDADVQVECQFGINTPVRKPTRVRGVHVDSPKKLCNALLYMRLDEDHSDGGHLEICRFRDKPRFQNVACPDDSVEVVDHILYQANTLIFMVNSPFALHGVTARYPTPHIRRYINFLAELREPIFDLAPYQDNETPWALMAH